MQTVAFHFPLPPRQDGPLAITHVTVLPMDEERVLPDQTVVLRDGSIEALGPAPTLTTDNVPQIDGTGHYLVPGLADMHVHYWAGGNNPCEFALFLANGVTFVNGFFFDKERLEELLRQRIAAITSLEEASHLRLRAEYHASSPSHRSQQSQRGDPHT